MATSRSLGQFEKRMGRIGKGVLKNVEMTVRRAALAADNALVISTPKDTGRAAGNWVTSIGSPQLEEIIVGLDDNAGAAATAALAQGAGVISRWKVRMGPIFISNSVPYIEQLESGSSQQAPAGMTAFAIAAAERQLKKAKLLRGL